MTKKYADYYDNVYKCPIIEYVINTVGMDYGGWDMIDPREIRDAFLKAFDNHKLLSFFYWKQ